MAEVRREDILLPLLLVSRESVPLGALGTLVPNLLELAVSKPTLPEDLLLGREALLSTRGLLPLIDSFMLLPAELGSEDEPSADLLVLIKSVLRETC